MINTEQQTRCATIALIGLPNAGKSTLLNRLVGSDIAAVTHKAQTTRARLRGIAAFSQTQLIFVDTPGLFSPRSKLDKAMVKAAWDSAADADATLFVLDAARILQESERELMLAIQNKLPDKKPRALALNKIDRIKRENLLSLAADIDSICDFSSIFMISARTGDGVDAAVKWMCELAPVGPWLFADDDISDAPMRALAAEITREKLFLRLHDELPYYLTVEPQSWQDRKDGSTHIEQIIYVAQKRHRQIVLGKNGQMIKRIGIAARKAIAELLGQEVHLSLRVSVSKDWMNKPEHISAIGLEHR